MRAAVALGLLAWVGAALVLAELRWFSRPSLADRLRPYAPVGVGGGPSAPSPFSVESFRDLVAPLAASTGARAARLFGVQEEAALRLERIHSPLDVTAFRVRQLGWAVVAVAAAVPGAMALRLPPLPALAFVTGAALLAFLVPEQQLASASQRRQRRLLLELPVVSEQLGMLLGAGYSLGAALHRLASRGSGVCATDVRRVTARTRHGVPVDAALREWAAVARVPALDRLVAVLALNRETGDLGRLISDEARAIRQEVQREAVATMERRAQQVWVPVTVATLVPGVIFLSVPFVEALRLFSGS
ncbi:MAG TPA: type II secretion system F family protein [Acidimicrobiales bacterium]|nr:type II secretion system F family protein [Acidimicrobiales bacterium]